MNSWRRYFLAGLMPLGATLPLWVLRDVLTSANFSLVYLLVVLVSAIYQGTGPSLFAGFISFLCFNFFLVQPLYTFLVADPRDFLDLIIYLISAATTGQLASYARNQKRNAQQRADELNILYEAANVFNHLTDSNQVYEALKQILRDRLRVQHVDLLPSVSTTSTSFSDTNLYIPVIVGDHLYSTLDIKLIKPLTPLQNRLMTACTSQAAVALQRIELMQRVQQTKTFEEADRLKTALLHSVSHDLRTPITIIKTAASNLARLDHVVSEQNSLEMLQGIEAEADHLNKMVGNLLDISRLEAGVLQINNALNSLEEVINDVAARIWHLRHEERLEIMFAPDLPLLNFDYGLVLQALSNLVENALRYEPAESRIKIVASLQAQEAHIAVINHGSTIAPEERDIVMEPFYHSEGGNTGLGLAIAKGIIEAHYGRLWIEDTPGGGATFILALPLITPTSIDSGNLP